MARKSLVLFAALAAGHAGPERLATPDAVAPFLRDEQVRMARLVKAAGIKPE